MQKRVDYTLEDIKRKLADENGVACGRAQVHEQCQIIETLENTPAADNHFIISVFLE